MVGAATFALETVFAVEASFCGASFVAIVVGLTTDNEAKA